jgi:hypothetical protein
VSCFGLPTPQPRLQLAEEVRLSSSGLRTFLAQQMIELKALPRFEEWVGASLRPDAANQARVETIVLPRLREITGEQARR